MRSVYNELPLLTSATQIAVLKASKMNINDMRLGVILKQPLSSRRVHARQSLPPMCPSLPRPQALLARGCAAAASAASLAPAHVPSARQARQECPPEAFPCDNLGGDYN